MNKNGRDNTKPIQNQDFEHVLQNKRIFGRDLEKWQKRDLKSDFICTVI
jgi:hypothetical protein